MLFRSDRPRASHARHPATLAAALVVGAGLTLAAVWGWVRAHPPAPDTPVRFSIVSESQTRFGAIFDHALAISPDGARLVWASLAGTGLSVRELNEAEPRALPGTPGGRSPTFSPDGKWVAYFAGTAELRKVAIAGGPAVPLAKSEGGPRGLSWGPGDRIVFATNNPGTDRKSTCLNSSHVSESRMPSSA